MTLGERGFALIGALFALMLITMMGMSLIVLGQIERATSANWVTYTQLFYAAEAGTESGTVQLRDLLAGTPAPTQAALDALQSPSLTDPGMTTSLVVTVQTVQDCEHFISCFPGANNQAGIPGRLTTYRVQARAQTLAGFGTVTHELHHFVATNGPFTALVRGRWNWF